MERKEKVKEWVMAVIELAESVDEYMEKRWRSALRNAMTPEHQRDFEELLDRQLQGLDHQVRSLLKRTIVDIERHIIAQRLLIRDLIFVICWLLLPSRPYTPEEWRELAAALAKFPPSSRHREKTPPPE